MSVDLSSWLGTHFLEDLREECMTSTKDPVLFSAVAMYFPSSYAATVTISFVNICTPTTEMNTNVKTEPMGDMVLIIVEFKV